MIVLLLAAATLSPVDLAFQHLYNADFPGAHRVLDEALRQEPANPLYHAVRAAACRFSEMDRLRILETDFFLDGDNISSRKKLSPDPAIRARLFGSIDRARALARSRLAGHPDGSDSLFAMCMAASVVTDYTGLVERRQWRSGTLAAGVNAYAQKLIALQPPVVDACLHVGAVEYIVGSLPFFVRCLVHPARLTLFDSRTFRHWQDPARKSPPGDSWVIEDGALRTVKNPRIAEDLFTTES